MNYGYHASIVLTNIYIFSPKILIFYLTENPTSYCDPTYTILTQGKQFTACANQTVHYLCVRARYLTGMHAPNCFSIKAHRTVHVPFFVFSDFGLLVINIFSCWFCIYIECRLDIDEHCFSK